MFNQNWECGQNCSKFTGGIYKRVEGRDFPGGSLVKAARFQCQGWGFNLWPGIKILHVNSVAKT